MCRLFRRCKGVLSVNTALKACLIECRFSVLGQGSSWRLWNSCQAKSQWRIGHHVIWKGRLAAWVLAGVLKQLVANRINDDWFMLRGVAVVKVFPLYIMHFLWNFFEHSGIYVTFTVLLSEPPNNAWIVAKTFLQCGHKYVAGSRLFHTQIFFSTIQLPARWC